MYDFLSSERQVVSLMLFYPVQDSVSQNPYFFHGPVGFVVPPGTSALIVRLFSNKSATYPEGFLDRNTLKSFYAMTGPDNSLIYTPGAERIPTNWYKRAPDDLYGGVNLAFDFKTIAQQNPSLLAFGGNTGTVNSFTGLSATNFTVCVTGPPSRLE